MNRIMMMVAVAAFALVAGACSIDVERNADGSLQVQTVLTEESLATELERGLDDPQVNILTVDMKDGHALVAVERERDSGFGVDNISFRVELFVADGHLGADVTDAVWNDVPIPQDLVDIWNEELAAELEAGAKEDPDNTLIDVEFSETALTMELRIETEESNG